MFLEISKEKLACFKLDQVPPQLEVSLSNVKHR